MKLEQIIIGRDGVVYRQHGGKWIPVECRGGGMNSHGRFAYCIPSQCLQAKTKPDTIYFRCIGEEMEVVK